MNPLKAGDRVAEFELPDQTGTPRRLTDLLSAGPMVLFFYPAAMTPGCTKEACHFRDLAAEFAAVGATTVGISADPVDKQAKFAHQQGLVTRCCPTPTARWPRSSGSNAGCWAS